LKRRPVPLIVVGPLLAYCGSCGTFPEDLSRGSDWPSPERGAVVSEHPLATRAGLEILEAGGNAADAAVATALALAVVYPQAGNLGGGGFAVWVPHDTEEDPLFLDFRETAPRALTPGAFLDTSGELVGERSLTGHLAVAVPGSPRGLWVFHERLGRLPFGEVARPAIELAAEGFHLDAWLARDLRQEPARRRLEASIRARATFYPRDRALGEGALLRQPDLARTLTLLVERGPESFYEGEVAAAIVGEMIRGGGVLDRQDLAAYEPVWREPLRGWFRGLEIITAPPPSSGGLILLQVLGILDGFPLDEERRATLDALALERGEPVDEGEIGLSSRALHWWIEAMRRGFADRVVHMGDPDFWDVPVEELLSPSWIAERRISIGELANPGITAMPTPAPRSGGEETTHLCALDDEGNAVSLTTTLNTSFGSGVMVPDAGFLLNNEIDDFSIVAGEPNVFGLIGADANLLEPRKRPLSSMTPTVIRDGGQAVRMVIGAPGGPRIITAVIQVILRTEVYGQGLEAAIRARRLHQQFSPLSTSHEPGWDADLLLGLRNRGHDLVELDRRFASVQAIRLEIGGEPEGFSDPRRGGTAGAEGRRPQVPALPPDWNR